MHLPASHYLPRVSRSRGVAGLLGKAPSILQGEFMKQKLASDIPFDGELVVVDEDDYAATRTPEALTSALDVIDAAAKRAKTGKERVAIDGTLFSIEGARAVRELAANEKALAEAKALADKGDVNAKALLIAVNVAAASDMKEDARDVARGLKAGHGAAVRTAQAIARAAASPGEKQGYAKAMVGLIEECVGEACDVQ